jgi:hypothetical protein
MGKKVVYRKEYKIRLVGDGGVEASIPRVIVERAARQAGMSLEDFVRTHRIVHLYNDFTDFTAAYRFVPAVKTEEIEVPEIA